MLFTKDMLEVETFDFSPPHPFLYDDEIAPLPFACPCEPWYPPPVPPVWFEFYVKLVDYQCVTQIKERDMSLFTPYYIKREVR